MLATQDTPTVCRAALWRAWLAAEMMALNVPHLLRRTKTADIIRPQRKLLCAMGNALPESSSLEIWGQHATLRAA